MQLLYYMDLIIICFLDTQLLYYMDLTLLISGYLICWAPFHLLGSLPKIGFKVLLVNLLNPKLLKDYAK